MSDFWKLIMEMNVLYRGVKPISLKDQIVTFADLAENVTLEWASGTLFMDNDAKFDRKLKH